jgi:hypothetical protein
VVLECQVLAFSGQGPGVCAAGGRHDSGSGAYVVAFEGQQPYGPPSVGFEAADRRPINASRSVSAVLDRFSLHAGTGLHETDDTFAFALAPNMDLVAIKKAGDGDELHRGAYSVGSVQLAAQTPNVAAAIGSLDSRMFV